jgi:nicotinamidase-related amidase
MLKLEPKTTAVVLIDVQQGLLALDLAPHPAPALAANAAGLAGQAQAAGATLVLVRVAFAHDYADRPAGLTDVPMVLPPGGLPAGWSDFSPALADVRPDVVITKHQWSAFHGTELDLQLRRRGVTTIVLGGIATNFGVESTARDGWAHNYNVVVAEDACTSMAAELHRFAIATVLPRVARVRSCAEITAAWA